MSTTAPIVCILNAGAHSDTAQDCREELDALFSKQGQTVQILLAQKGGDITTMAKQALAQNCTLLIAAGGDGTMNAVATELAGKDTPMGVLPLGTLNHFARDLNIPLKLEDAVANCFHGTTEPVDVGEVNGHIFLNNSSIGLYPGLVVQRESLQRSGARKWPAFGRSLAYVLWRYSSLTAAIDLDGKSMVTKTPFIFVGNNRYEISAPHLGERKSLREGRLWIYQAPRATRLKLFWLALRSLIGWTKPAELAERDAREFTIRASARRLKVATDGEVMTMSLPLHYRIRPQALRVVVPPQPET